MISNKAINSILGMELGIIAGAVSTGDLTMTMTAGFLGAVAPHAQSIVRSAARSFNRFSASEAVSRPQGVRRGGRPLSPI